MSTDERECRMAPPGSAVLGRYLDHLLCETDAPWASVPGSAALATAGAHGPLEHASRAADEPADVVPTVTAATPRRDRRPAPVAPVPAVLLPVAVALAEQAPLLPPAAAAAPTPHAAAPESAPRPAPAPASRPERARPPEWAAAPFQALLFRVGELAVAAPLVRLYGVAPWTDQVASLPNSPQWYLGLLHHREQHVRVVDTAQLVSGGQRFDAATPPQHIILLDEGRWGITCDGLSDVLELAPDQVKWCGAGAKRPWLAGIVRDRLCALLDVDALTGMLARG